MYNFKAKVRANNFKEYSFSIHANNIEDAKRIIQGRLRDRYPELSIISIDFECHVEVEAPFKVGDKVKCVATKAELEEIGISCFKYRPDDIFTIKSISKWGASSDDHYHTSIKGSSYIFDDFMFRKVEEPKVKEMTVKEIEEKLGYSIKVVKE